MIFKVAIPHTPCEPLDYLALPSSNPQNRIGCRVQVPFRKKTVIGIVVGFSETSLVPQAKLKSIMACIDETPLLCSVLDLYRWVGSYYHVALSEVLAQALPIKFRTLIKKKSSVKEISAFSETSLKEAPLPLNEEQNRALQAILLSAHAYQCFLIQGVTGSGKTEVYLQAIHHFLQQKKQVLVLVPEIGLTVQLVSRFQKRFQCRIGLLHSGLNDTERLDTFLLGAEGRIDIMIGTRSAVFAPLPHLGIIVIDEEHDLSFKQQESLRYSARDIAIKRAQKTNIPILLGTATPALETLHNAQQGRFQSLFLTKPAAQTTPTWFKIIDMRGVKITHGVSLPLKEEISQVLERGEQVLIFVNRRGYAPVLLCQLCGKIVDCLHCDAHLTLHLKENELRCHHCETHYPFPKFCVHCSSLKLVPLGVGTERLENHLSTLFPNAHILRVDRDTTRRKHALKNALEQIDAGSVNLLIGTQMLTKGHHFPNLTLVAVINADYGFFSRDFRASERLGQLLLQVAGRAGREDKPGRVLIQTYVPDHPLLNLLIKNGYPAFSEALLSERIDAHFPPYAYMALLRSEQKEEARASQILLPFKERLRKAPGLRVLGPAPASVSKKANTFRAQLLLIAEKREDLREALQVHWAPLPLKEKMQVSLEIDPQEVL